MRDDIVAGYPFPLDRFQLDALDAVDAGRHVVVAAPTGSGKTVVAEYGIEVMRRRGQRAFYTAPLKALSNQKFRDLTAAYGVGNVGLLTGDNAIAAEAPVVVMTTEVLRNMIYARSRALHGLGLVVLDEVHFLMDAYRGPVWEEVIIHLPDTVQLVCLSATVSNSDELAAWIETVRGPTTSVTETRRPVRLNDHYLVGDRTNDRLHFLPTFVDGLPNPDAVKLDAMAVRGGGRYGRRPPRGSGQRVLYTPSRPETVDLLDRHDLLPAIFFIFSRNQCEEAARAAVAGGVRLVTDAERTAIAEVARVRLGHLAPDDLAVLGYDDFLAQLESGVAPHHAGMVPAFKETVEQCFTAGLLKVVFATETLAVGVNMPARTVVIEKLTKFTGEHHEMLTPGEYTQLTGRAGRRGIDLVGQAVVLWSPFVPFEQVAGLAGSRSFHLRSAFRPNYNMAANLVRTHTPVEARHLLNLSFAQYQADRSVVSMEARTDRLRARLTGARSAASSTYGDIWEYRAQQTEARATARAERGRPSERESALGVLRPGDVVDIRRARYSGPAVMVSSARRKAGMRLLVVTADAETMHVSADDVVGPVVAHGHIQLPGPFDPTAKRYRRDVARRLAKATLRTPKGTRRRAPDDGPSVRRHPVELDPDLRARMQSAGEAERLERQLHDLESRIDGGQRSLGAELDRVIDVLVRRGYVTLAGDSDAAHESEVGGSWGLTDRGRVLSRLFHESDLLVAECLVHGRLDGMRAPGLAGLLSTFVYEHRSPEPPPPPWFPSAEAGARWRQIAATSQDLAADEQATGLGVHRSPDAGFFAAAHAWVAGHPLHEVVADEGLGVTGGDFVRTTKQLIDLARQVAEVAPDYETRAAARDVADQAFRGIVADGSLGSGT